MPNFRACLFAAMLGSIASSALAGGGGGCWEPRDKLYSILKSSGHECTYTRYKDSEREGRRYFETQQECTKGESRLEITSLYRDDGYEECGEEILTAVESYPNDCGGDQAMRIVYDAFRGVKGGYCETRGMRTICDQPYYTGISATYFVFDRRESSTMSCSYRMRVTHIDIKNKDRLWRMK